MNQSRTQSPLAFWSAGSRQERLWADGIFYPTNRRILALDCACLGSEWKSNVLKWQPCDPCVVDPCTRLKTLESFEQEVWLYILRVYL